MEVDAKRPRGGRVGSMRTPADKGEVSKIGKSYGHLMWMAPIVIDPNSSGDELLETNFVETYSSGDE